MSDLTSEHPTGKTLSRRRLFAVSAAVGSSIGLGSATAALGAPPPAHAREDADHGHPAIVPFWGPRQHGITMPQQRYTYFAAFDCAAEKRAELVDLLRAWTDAAARLTSGQAVQAAAGAYDASKPIVDSGEALGLSPAHLTLTVGFGAGLFTKDGADRYGLAAQRPAAFVDLPRFPGEQLIPEKTGGDLSLQACADDPQVAFHAVRQLARMAGGVAHVRWVQTGFLPDDAGKETPRNLMGFKDGTQECADLDRFVWAGSEAPRWMRGGTYLVVRRIRIALEHWDQMNVGFQEQTIGRQKQSGAPIGMTHESDPLPLAATDKDGNPIIAENAHVRLGNASTNNGQQILRRGYNYNDGVNFVAERWPPWRQGMEYDAGLLFVSYQRDPRTGFIPMFEQMSRVDMLNQFATHTGGGLFAIPAGAQRGEYLGAHLFAS
jgi:deferrochelatase/peroxidase EfeB